MTAPTPAPKIPPQHAPNSPENSPARSFENSPETSPKTWVLASDNAHKIAEMTALLAPIAPDIALVGQGRLGVTPAEETGVSFVENALIKAKNAARQTGMPALADDSGLCVAALNGAPGVYSARYGGRHGDDAANNAALLAALADHNDRRGYFVCVLVWVESAEDPDPIIARGVWQGQILTAPLGEQGFGYDPLFWVASAGMTAAEMSPADKNQHSHRAQAMAQLRSDLRKRLS